MCRTPLGFPVEPDVYKIKSGSSLRLELEPTAKLSTVIKGKYPQSKLVLFKAEFAVSQDDLIDRAMSKLKKCNADLIIANDLTDVGAGIKNTTNHVFLIEE